MSPSFSSTSQPRSAISSAFSCAHLTTRRGEQVGHASMVNFALSVQTGVWGFRNNAQPEQAFSQGDILFFAAGYIGNIRLPESEWLKHSITLVATAQIASPLKSETTLQWPDETAANKLLYPKRFTFENLQRHEGQYPLHDANFFPRELTLAIRKAAIGGKAQLLEIPALPAWLTSSNAPTPTPKPAPTTVPPGPVKAPVPRSIPDTLLEIGNFIASRGFVFSSRVLQSFYASQVEDTAVELSTGEERQRIEWAHEYGLVAIVPTQQQLDYILQSGVYHTPYDKHRKWGLRLRADFILFLLSESKFPGQSGVAYQAEIQSVHFGVREEITPTPPPSQRASTGSDNYVWFTVGNPRAISPVLPYAGAPPRFAFTTRLAFNEASNVSELLLIREPERRFYQECRNAGFQVAVYDESSGSDQVFDIGQLRLRFSVSKDEAPAVQIRFDPWTARFSGPDWGFTWTELMFRPEECLKHLLEPQFLA